jgi:hypothetical protein
VRRTHVVALTAALLLLGPAVLAQSATKTTVQAPPGAPANPPAPPPPAQKLGTQDTPPTSDVVPPPPPADAKAPDTSSSPSTASDTFNTRVKTLEEQVVDLKEKIYRTKARLLLLQETVLGGDLSSGARAIIYSKNDMGGTFALESVAYALDGAPIFTKADKAGDLANRPELEIFNGRIVPGQHQIAVRLVYRGRGYGVFSYLEGYKFTVTSSYTFNAEPGKVTTVKVVGYEKGGLTTDLKDRPAVRYDVEVTKDAGLKAAQGEGTKPAAPAGQTEQK